jgi:hypothetical protein
MRGVLRSGPVSFPGRPPTFSFQKSVVTVGTVADRYRAMKARNMSINPGEHIISDLLNGNAAVEKVTVVEKNLPMTPWSDGMLSNFGLTHGINTTDILDPLLQKVG